MGPVASHPSASAALLEREAELARLDDVPRDACAGHGTILVIRGPAGIGKTRLLAAAREAAVHAGMRGLVARGSESERGAAFDVVRQLFEPVLRAGAQEEMRTLLSGAAGVAARLVRPASTARRTARMGADPMFELLHGLYWLTANLADRSPVLLALDDVQWADEPSFAVRRVPDATRRGSPCRDGARRP